MTISRQLSKINIFCYEYEKTPKYSENEAEKAINMCKKLALLLDKNILLMMAQTCKETITTTRMNN